MNFIIYDAIPSLKRLRQGARDDASARKMLVFAYQKYCLSEYLRMTRHYLKRFLLLLL